MKPRYTTFIGIDISKATLDLSVKRHGNSTHFKVENSVDGLMRLFKETPVLKGLKWKNTLVCFEAIGVYQRHLVDFLLRKKAAFTMQNPLHLKLSMGLVRGKSDKVDAERIADFAERHWPTVRLYEAPRQIIIDLRELIAVRKRLLNVREILSCPINEIKAFAKPGQKLLLPEACAQTLAVCKRDLENIQILMQAKVGEDARLARLYEIVTSVRFVGPVTALSLIAITNEFKNFESAAKLASYIGIAPFSRSSGTSLNARPRVSNFGAKDLKGLLHMALIAMLSQKKCPERKYYDRKKAEGKHTFVVLNAMKNKILKQIFACVKADRVAEKTEGITAEALPGLS